jgi:putative component of membrane protein insertase Oxa1/YidC/SpoIIIJ protein YidD
MMRLVAKPWFWLASVSMLVVGAGIDGFRAPSEQITAKVYIGAVRGYQHWGRPLLRGCVHCRYRPSCSEYSIQAVQKVGIFRGLALSASRLCRCRASVPPNTPDPVPDG